MNCCQNCKYAEPMVGALACMGQKGMPCVRPTDNCDSWKSAKQTNADRIRSMTDEELAEWLEGRLADCLWCDDSAPVKPGSNECELADCTKCALDWLRREVSDAT